MHAYLVIGNNAEKVREEANKMAESLGNILNFNISKISDVRELGKITKLAFKSSTAFLIENIDEATTEALNAFLKNLEEPQKNANYVLTATNEYSILPTIVSRCQIVRVNTKAESNAKNSIDILSLEAGERLKLISNINKREDAKDFLKKIIFKLHGFLIDDRPSKILPAKALGLANDTLKSIDANANVGLQLTNFSINIDTLLESHETQIELT